MQPIPYVEAYAQPGRIAQVEHYCVYACLVPLHLRLLHRLHLLHNAGILSLHAMAHARLERHVYSDQQDVCAFQDLPQYSAGILSLYAMAHAQVERHVYSDQQDVCALQDRLVYLLYKLQVLAPPIPTARILILLLSSAPTHPDKALATRSASM